MNIEIVELLDSGLIILINIRLVGDLEGLDLRNSLVTVFIDLSNCFNHSVQISAFDTEFFFQLEVHLLEDYSFASHLIDFLPEALVLSHGVTVALVRLIKAVLNDLRLLVELRSSILVRARGPTKCCTLLSLLLNNLSLQVLHFLIDPLTSGSLSVNFLEKILNLLFLGIVGFLSDILLFVLFGHYGFLHLKFFQQFKVFDIQFTHFFLLLAELDL